MRGRGFRGGLLGPLLFAIGAAFANPAPAPADGQVPTTGQAPAVTIQVDTAVVTVGDPITLRVTVDHAAGEQVIWPDSLDLAPFEVAAARAFPPTTEGERARSEALLTLVAFELGDLEIPSFQLEVVDEEGAATTLSTDRYGIQVLSVGLDEGGDIREIKGPLGIPVSVVTLSLLLLALVGAAVLAWFLFKRPKKEPEALALGSGPAQPWRPPHEVALEALAQLEASPLLDKDEIKEFHIRLSDVLRTYVEGRFLVPALEMTTSEVLQGLEEAGEDTGLVERFGSFLLPCDMVKFAKQRPSPEDALSLLQAGRRLVEDTIPVPRTAATGNVQDGVPGSGDGPLGGDDAPTRTSNRKEAS